MGFCGSPEREPGAPNGADGDGAAPNGDVFVAEVLPPNANADFGASAGFAALFDAPPKGDEAAGVDEAPPNALLDGVLPPNANADFGAEGAEASLFAAAPNGLDVLEAAGCELLLPTPKPNVGVEVAGEEDAPTPFAAGVEEGAAVDGFDVTPKLNFGPEEGAAAAFEASGPAADVLAGATSCLTNENVGVDVAVGCDGGGPMPKRDNKDVPGAGAAFDWSVFAVPLPLEALPNGDGAWPDGCADGVAPKENVGFGAPLPWPCAAFVARFSFVAGVAEEAGAGALGAKKFGADADGVVVGAADGAGVCVAGFEKKLGTEEPACGAPAG